MKPIQYAVIFIVIVIVLGYFFVEKLLSKKYLDELTDALLAGKFGKFDKLVEDKKVKYFVNPFNITYLKLNSYMFRNNLEKAIETFNILKKVKLSKNQVGLVFINCFTFFMANDSLDEVKYCYSRLKEANLHEKYKMQYEIVVEKSVEYENELLKKLQTGNDSEKGSIAYLLSVLCENKNDKENSDKYYQLSKEYLSKVSEALNNRING